MYLLVLEKKGEKLFTDPSRKNVFDITRDINEKFMKELVPTSCSSIKTENL
jgi:hypothetical protein